MKKLISLLILVAFCVGCSESAPKPKKRERSYTPPLINKDFSQNLPSEIGHPLDYFPQKAGTTWVYKITLGEVEPVATENILWPRGSVTTVYRQTRRFKGVFTETGKKEFTLKKKIKGPATKQGELSYPIGVEYTIEEDDLGVYEDAKQVFLAATVSGGMMAHEVVSYDSHSTPGAPSGAWGRWGSKDGFSMRIIFFGRPPGTMLSMGRGISSKNSKDKNDIPEDSLMFIGLENIPTQNELGMHFKRMVKGQPRISVEHAPEITKESGSLGKSFTEDTWYVKDKGLVLLEQRVEGKPSMTWKLTSFSP